MGGVCSQTDLTSLGLLRTEKEAKTSASLGGLRTGRGDEDSPAFRNIWLSRGRGLGRRLRFACSWPDEGYLGRSCF